MRRTAAAIAVALLVGAAGIATPQVQPDRLLEHVRFLSSDEMKGRGNGTPELQQAADYIQTQFEGVGLRPGSEGRWQQPFEVVTGLAIGDENHLTIEDGDISIRLELGTGYYPLAAGAIEGRIGPSTELEDLPLVFAGYGLSVPNQEYDDYAGLDVYGKAVLIFSHEPQEHNTRSRLNGARPVPQSTLQAKAAAARNKGARLLLVVSDPTHRSDEANYGHFLLEPEAESVGLPVLRVNRDRIRPLLDAWGLEALARDIDRTLTPRSRFLSNATTQYVEHLFVNRQVVNNVVGVLPGNDPARASEAIVIGAHYDHVGIGGQRSTAPERTGEIHNGADDNASGIAAIIEIAREAVRTPERFPRTLIFVAFAAEEIGLLGSEHYVRNPSISLTRTVAMLNLDMVGRSRGAVDISGMEHAPTLEPDLRDAIQAAGRITVRRQGPGAGRSDDWSFINRRVPAINFFTGFHRDYHQPGDDWDKVDLDGIRRIATLALEFAARIAARDAPPEFKGP